MNDNGEEFYGEGDYHKFKMLAERRTQQALLNIRRLSNLSNKRHYRYKNSDVKKIINVILKELKNTDTIFTREMEQNDSQDFKL